MESSAASSRSLNDTYKEFCACCPSRRAVVLGHAWRYRESGARSNPTVLLLPGALGRSETSFAYIAALAPYFHVVAPGYPATIRTMTDLSDGAAALLEACGVCEAHIVGGSFGGLGAQALLARHPECVGRIVLSDTSPPTTPRAPGLRLSAALIRLLPERFTKSVIGFGVGRYVSALPTAARRFWRNHFREMLAGLTRAEIEARARIWAEFDRTRWPKAPAREMLVLGAASDRSISPHRFLARYPQAKIHVVASHLGHAASIGDAAAYIKPILAFLTKGVK